MMPLLHSSLLLYEVDDALEAMAVINKHLIIVSPFQQPRKQMHAAHVWKIVSIVTLWILWKYCRKRLYESIIPPLRYIVGNMEELIGGCDNMLGSSEVVL